MYRHADQRQYFGVSVRMLWPHPEDLTSTLPKLDAAIGLLKQYDTRRFDRLLQNVRGIFLFGTTGDLAYWLSSLGLVVMQESFVRSSDTSVPLLASTLIHESCHAWLDRLGFDYTLERRPRIEAICARSEIAFAKHLPEANRKTILDRAEKLLAMHPSAWSPDAFRARKLAHLQTLDVPRWLIACLDFVTRRQRLE
jgi:hypothetical protein